MGGRGTELTAVSSPTVDPELAPGHDPGSRAALFPRWWLWPLAAYLLFRIADAVMILVASQHAGSLINQLTGSPLNHTYGRSIAPPGYLTTATNWDGQWYWEIADRGYPAHLPHNPSGAVAQNPWAFFPAYPMTVRLIMAATGLGFPLSAVLLSLVAGAIAILLVYRLVAPVTDRLGARLLIVMINAFICAPALQIAYTESMAFALLMGSLLAFQARRFGLTAVLVLVLSLTRAVVLPLSAVFAIYAVLRWRSGASRKEVTRTAALAAWTAATTLLWPVVAGVVTGEPKAYLLTQASWNPHVAELPVLRFIGRVSSSGAGPLVGGAAALAWITVVVLALIAGQRQQLLRWWTGIYALYLLAAIDWNSTIIRYFLLAVPGLWAPTDPTIGWSRRNRVGIVAAVAVFGLVAQWWWIRYSLTISPEFYQLP